MSGWLQWVSPGITLLIGVLVYLNARRQNRTGEKKLSLEEQQEANDREDVIAKRRAEELERLYERVDKLEKTVEALQEADREKQQTINYQADELQRTNQVLAAVRTLFLTFERRVREAWENGHTMPTLTSDERALLEDTIPRATYLTRRNP